MNFLKNLTFRHFAHFDNKKNHLIIASIMILHITIYVFIQCAHIRLYQIIHTHRCMHSCRLKHWPVQLKTNTVSKVHFIVYPLSLS